MPYNQVHAKLTWGGSMGNPELEVWANSLTLIATNPTSPTPDAPIQIPFEAQEELMWACRDALTAFHGANSGMNPAFRLSWVKLNMIGNDGKYIYPDTTQETFTPVVPTNSTSASWRVTTAVTLRTERARGAGSVSRFYPPHNTSTNENANSPYMTPTAAGFLRDRAKVLVDAINAIDVNPQVKLNVGVAPIRATLAQAIQLAGRVTSIEVDRVIDTQRRRTNRVPRLVVPPVNVVV